MFFPRVQHGKLVCAMRICLFFALISAFGLARSYAQSQTTDPDPPVASVPVVVSDFELFAVPVKASSPATPAVSRSKQKPQAPDFSEGADAPLAQARRLRDFFAATLVETLRKSGYTTRRARGQNPPQGALLRGVFAEPDEENRVRRTLLGGTSANPKFFLYVGIFNLARPDQPLYQLAPEQPAGDQFGPVIVLNNYIPLAKYELDKNPTEEDVRQVCAQIATSLTTLLAANPAAFR